MNRIPTLPGGAAVFAAWLLAACSASDTGTTLESAATGGAKPAAEVAGVVDEVQDPRAYCPKAVMRAGTETLNVYPDNVRADDPEKAAKLRFRATITDLVRECNSAGSQLLIRVGVAGRTISGPSGETGKFEMPLRVAVTRGDEVLYSQLHELTGEIPAGNSSSQFSYVDSNIAIPIPERENIIIYVGFDELRVDRPGAVPARLRQPVN